MKLSPLFSDHMILQRGKRVPVWGEAAPGVEVRISIQGASYSAKADASGSWCVPVGPLDAQESGTLEIAAGSERILLQDVAVGDVYLAGGQSNMEFLMRYEQHFAAERESCFDPLLRFYDVPEIAYDGQDRDFDYSRVGLWRSASKEDLDYFSAPGYYFAKPMSVTDFETYCRQNSGCTA